MDDLLRFSRGYLSFPSTQFIALDATDGYWASYSSYRCFESMGSGYPKGNYKYGFQETSGEWTTFNYTATDQLPFAESPAIKNYESLQNLFTDQSFRITWETGRPFRENLRVEVEIRHIRDDGARRIEAYIAERDSTCFGRRFKDSLAAAISLGVISCAGGGKFTPMEVIRGICVKFAES